MTLREQQLRLLTVGLALLAGGCASVARERTPGSYKDFSKEQELATVSSIQGEIDFPFGRLDLSALPDDSKLAYRLGIHYDDHRLAPELEARGVSNMDFRFKLKQLSKSSGASGNLGRFQFTPLTPLELGVTVGIGSSQVDLTGLRIRELRLANGVGDARIQIDRLNAERCHSASLKSGLGKLRVYGLGNLNCENITFRGGVGEADLDFTGTSSGDSRVDMKVGVGQINVVLPASVGAEIHSTRRFLSRLSVQDFREDGPDVYRSRNYDSTTRHVSFEVESGIGEIKFSWQ